MARCIEVETCRVCPHRDHKGAHGQPAYVPVCRKAGREMPYTVHAGSRGGTVAYQTDGIPDWCPLPVMPS